MLRIFRKNREKNLLPDKFGKYLLYAIGEILLVVVGILIAVAINNRNEQRKRDTLQKTYRTSLISELQADLQDLNARKNAISRRKKTVRSYIDYFNTNAPERDVLLRKQDSIDASKSAFYTSTYTIEDLITTGNLSLFSKKEKSAILKLKNAQERYYVYETQTIDHSTLYEQELLKRTDLLFMNKYSDKQHQSVAGWRGDLDSEQFRILNNTVALTLKLFEFQEELYSNLSEETQTLMAILKQNQS